LIKSQLPGLNTRLLIGSDNVDRWGEKSIWEAALRGIQVVVSTHAILFDALSHGFVRMNNLALLVFDEGSQMLNPFPRTSTDLTKAHHCVKNHPANGIMQNFYHRIKAAEGPKAVPHILGFSASPIMRSKASDLK
jgi:hypothetical protein